MADLTHQLHVAQWLVRLGKRCAPVKGMVENAELLKEYIPPIAAALPAEAFSDASLDAMSPGKFEFFPTLKALHKELTAWWRDNRPQAPALPCYGDETLSHPDRLALSLWNKRRGEGFPGTSMAAYASLYRRHHPGAFAVLLRIDENVAKLAIERGWMRDPSEAAADHATEADAIHRTVVNAFHIPDSARTLDAGSGRSTIAPEALASFARAYEGAHGRPPGALPPEVLDALRAQNGVLAQAQRVTEAAKAQAAPQPHKTVETPPTASPGPPRPWLDWPDSEEEP